MPDALPTWVQDWSASSLLALVVVLVLLGWLVPRWTYRQTRADLLPWREAAEKANATVAELSANMAKLVEAQTKMADVVGQTHDLVRQVVRKDPVP